MKYIYNKNLKETEQSKPFIRIMKKLDKIQDAICVCNDIDDELLREALEGKQCKLIQKLTLGYLTLFGIEARYSVGELFEELDNGGCIIEFMNQQNIISIEEQLLNMEV